MSIIKWSKFAEKTVKELAQVKEGENLLIIADTNTNMDIAEACLAAGLERTSNAQLLVMRRILDNERGELNPVIHNAVVNSDVVIGLFQGSKFFSTNTRTEAVKKGTRIVSTQPIGIEEFIIQAVVDVDFQKMYKNAELMAELWKKSKKCRITSSEGTDISFEFQNRPILIGDGAAKKPGEVKFFPGMTVVVAPVEETINGTIVVDGNIVPGGIVSSPVTIKIEKGMIVNIEGKAEANLWRNWLSSLNDSIIYYLSHVKVGLNPKAKLSGNETQDEVILGAVSFGFGRQPEYLKGKIVGGKFQTEVILVSPNIYVDDTVVSKNNNLNEELGFIKMV